MLEFYETKDLLQSTKEEFKLDFSLRYLLDLDKLQSTKEEFKPSSAVLS